MAEASILFLVRVCDCRFLHLYRAEASPGAERFACRVDFSRFCFLPIHNFTRLPATVCFYPNLYSPVGVGSECPICHVCELPMRHFVFRSLPKFQAANVAVANVNWAWEWHEHIPAKRLDCLLSYGHRNVSRNVVANLVDGFVSFAESTVLNRWQSGCGFKFFLGGPPFAYTSPPPLLRIRFRPFFHALRRPVAWTTHVVLRWLVAVKKKTVVSI